MKNLRWASALAISGLFLAPALAQDNVEGPWGTAHGDNYGTQTTSTVVADAWADGTEAAWVLDTRANGLDRVVGRAEIVFDAAGNLYWVTSVSTPDGSQYLASVDPAGNIRWSTLLSQAGVGNWVSTAPIVGGDAVYAYGGGDYDYDGDGVDGNKVGAYDKATGAVIWELDLDGDWNNDGTAEATVSTAVTGAGLSPVLNDGKLYVIPLGANGAGIAQIDAATGAIDYFSQIDPMTVTAAGNVVLIPSAFTDGSTGLFFNVDDGANDFGAGTGLKDVFAIKLGATSATLAWTAPCGHSARASMTYSSTTGYLYAHTWNDYAVIDGENSAAFMSYDIETGTVIDHINPGYGHGFYDVAGLSADGLTIYTGGADGKVAAYDLALDGTIEDTVRTYFGTAWHGEYRVFGMVAPSTTGDPVFISGTNSRTDLDPADTARVVLLDMTLAGSAPDDSPLLMDDLEILQGPDFNTLTQVYIEDFETDPIGTAVTALSSPGTWNDASSGEPTPTTITNPYIDAANGSNAVLSLDPKTTGTWQGFQWDFAETVGTDFMMNSDPNKVALVIKWKQHRGDLTDNAFHQPIPQNYGVQWDIGPGIISAVGWAEDCHGTLHPGQWDEVELRYDFYYGDVDVYINGALDGDALPGDFVADENVGVTGFYFDLTGTDITANSFPPIAEYDTGIDNNHGYTIRGGPYLGPDGKIYYFHVITGELVAVQPTASWICGDTNCDGSIDVFDIDPFVMALVDAPGYAAAYPGCDILTADCNHDTVVDIFDIDPFVYAIVNGGCQ